jgi:membrane protein
MPTLLRRLTTYADRFKRAEIPTRAAALAYHTLLAIVPLVGLFFWYLTSIGVTEKYLNLSKTYIMAQLNVSSSLQFEEAFQRLTSQVGGKTWGYIGLVLLLYTVTNLIVKFADALDTILGTAKHKPDTHFTMMRLAFRRLVVMLGLPIALTLSLIVSEWVKSGSLLRFVFDLRTVGSYFALVIPVTADIITFFFVYHFIPRNPVPWREALKAAVVVGPISEFVRFGFSLYNSYSVSVHKIYGVLAIIPLFILWVQIAWMVILSGALLIRFKPNEKKQASTARTPVGNRIG